MDFIFEVLFELFMEMMFLIVPENKVKSKKHHILAITLALLTTVGYIALFIWGVILIDNGNSWGALPIILAILMSLTQFIIGVVSRSKE